MAYEKYIKKNGKLYGPYTYHSKRINGKVVSEYHGATKKQKSFQFHYSWLIGIFIGLILVGGFFFWNAQLSGKVSFDLNSDSLQGEPLEGVLSLGIKEGELMPASSKVLVDIGENSYEYTLSDLVEADAISGNFYVEGKTISGSGSGYGVSGVKTIYPEVDFTLNILSSSKHGKKNVKNTENPVDVEIPEVVEGVEEIETEEIGEGEEIEEEEIVEEEVEEEPEEVEEVEVEEEELEEGLEGEIAEVEAEEIEEQEEFEEEPEEVVESEVTATGAVIANLFKHSFESFLVLTGQASLKLSQEVDGSVSFGEAFTYELEEWEIAEIKSNSVKVDGEILSDNEIDLDIIDNKAVVTTEYSIEEEGFGEDYLGDIGETITIDLSQLDLTLEGETISIKIVYGEDELVSVGKSLTGDEIEIPEEETSEEESVDNTDAPLVEEDESEITNETEIISNITNQTEMNVTNVSIVENVTEVVKETTPFVIEILTDDERAILEEKYGDIIVDVTKAEIVRDRVEVTFKIGAYSVKQSYDTGLSNEELSEWIERDRTRLLKDIASELSQEESSSEAIDGIVGSYSI